MYAAIVTYTPDRNLSEAEIEAHEAMLVHMQKLSNEQPLWLDVADRR